MKPQSGDILIIKYYLDPIAYLIRKECKSKWNHIELVINDKFIAGAKGNGIKKNKINKYSNKFLYETKLLRIKGLTEEEKKKIIYCAEAQIGDKYNRFVWLYHLYLNWRGKPTAFINCCSFVALCFAVINKNFRGDKDLYKTTPKNIIDYVKGYNLVKN